MNTPLATQDSVETPSGKDAAYENFPVGSWLLPAHLRPHIAVYYNFARAIDDIADNPDTQPDEKIKRLSEFERAVLGEGDPDPLYATSHRMRDSLNETGTTPQHCLDLVDAFKQDAVKGRYDDWDDLMHYCIRSAAPVGRYLLDIHGGSVDGYGPSDALCNALQVINHLQDCQDDYQTMDRVYLPGDWMAAHGGTVEQLDQDKASPGIRKVIDQCLDATDELMIEARRLPAGLKSKRLAMESAFIVRIADALIKRLRNEDPVAGRVQLSKPQFVWCGIRGVGSVLF
ncbi:MAG: squalene synthase HpnC [Rhodospirillaceae bacterium]|jgi:hydroxysqualene synthase|nr:squalene synthase HpnC [Rhodospirillaceae bacterium]